MPPTVSDSLLCDTRHHAPSRPLLRRRGGHPGCHKLEETALSQRVATFPSRRSRGLIGWLLGNRDPAEGPRQTAGVGRPEWFRDADASVVGLRPGARDQGPAALARVTPRGVCEGKRLPQPGAVRLPSTARRSQFPGAVAARLDRAFVASARLRICFLVRTAAWEFCAIARPCWAPSG